MRPDNAEASPFTHGRVAALAVAVLLWRALAFAWPSSLITTADSLRLPLALLVVLFVACGVAAWWLRPGRASGIFLVYALGGGIHWGGSVGAPQPGLELGLLFGYLSVAAMAEAALLHFALIYPSDRRLPGWGRALLYSPAALALACCALAGVIPRSTLAPAIVAVLTIANAMSIAAVVVFLVSLWRTNAATRRAARLPLIVAGLLAGGGISALGAEGVLLPASEAWNVFNGLVPVCLAVALVTRHAGNSAKVRANA